MVTLRQGIEELLGGKDENPNIQFLFPIKCRELNTIDFRPADNFETIMAKLFLDLKELFDDLKDISHKIMFIVDGLDEMMSVGQLNQPLTIHYLRIQKMVQFVRDVLVSNNKIFPDQYPVAVGRPYITEFIKESFDNRRSLKCVYVCGFSKDNVNHYIDKHCDDKLKTKVTREIEQSQNLSAMSHVPVYLLAICDIYEDDIQTPRTTTELMVYACLVFIRRHLIDCEKDVKNLTLHNLCTREVVMKLIKSISFMSFESLLKKKLFENKELQDIFHDVNWSRKQDLSKNHLTVNRKICTSFHILFFTSCFVVCTCIFLPMLNFLYWVIN